MDKLLKLQKAIKPISKDSENPFYKSKYFDINTLIGDIKPIIDELGIVIMQPLSNLNGKASLKTILIDGETGKTIIEGETVLPENQDPQKMGGIITYFRRYSLQSLLLLEAEDDDANYSSGVKNAVAKPQGQKQAIQEPHYEQNSEDDGKPWITDVLFDEAIRKSIDAGIVKLGTPVEDVMKLLRTKYKVAKIYNAKVQMAIDNYIVR